jgi:hypothetical protein
MKLSWALGLVTMFIAKSALALSPSPAWKVSNTFGDVISYELADKKAELNAMSSEFSYDDLNTKEMNGLQSLIETKQEYGKVFGFADWKLQEQKLVEKNGERIVLLSGTYKDAQKQSVNFIEVYWANRSKSGQYLITSQVRPLKVDDYSNYLQ